MNYCAVNEAYDNNNIKQNKPENNNIIPPNTFDNYTDIEINKQNQNIYPAFFTAQGDYSSHGPYFGTSINELKDKTDEEMSLPDNYSFSDESLPSLKKKSKSIDHNYCIERIVKALTEDLETTSMASTICEDMDAVYAHVKKCKYCKNKINKSIKEMCPSPHIEVPKPTPSQQTHQNNVEHFTQNIGYGIKELLIIILGGIILVFILDLLVKIGKKLNK
jgi:hypothetical protein